MIFGGDGGLYGGPGESIDYMPGLESMLANLERQILGQNVNPGPIIAPSFGPSDAMTAQMMNSIAAAIEAGAVLPVDTPVPGENIAAAQVAAEAPISLRC